MADNPEFSHDIKDITDSTPISEVPPIELSRGETITYRSDVSRVVEIPLVPACEVLFDKNIETSNSSANSKHFLKNPPFPAMIELSYDRLSLRNKKIAEKLGHISELSYPSGPSKKLHLEIPITSATTVGEIKQAFLALVNQFEPQALKPSEVREIQSIESIKGLNRTYGGTQDEAQIIAEEKAAGRYYDADTRKFFPSKDLALAWKKENEAESE